MSGCKLLAFLWIEAVGSAGKRLGGLALLLRQDRDQCEGSDGDVRQIKEKGTDESEHSQACCGSAVTVCR